MMHSKMILCAILLLEIGLTRLQAQTINLKPDLNEPLISSLSQNSVSYRHNIYQISNEELTSQIKGLLHGNTLNHLTNKSKQPNSIERSIANERIIAKSYNYNEIEKDKRNHSRAFALGLASFYAATVIGDFIMDDFYRANTLIPVIGPFITIGIIENNSTAGYGGGGGQGLLILSGIAQTTFATLLVISLKKHTKPDETKNMTLESSLNSISLKIKF